MGKNFMKLYDDDEPVQVDLRRRSAALMPLRTSVWNIGCSHARLGATFHICVLDPIELLKLLGYRICCMPAAFPWAGGFPIDSESYQVPRL